MNLSRKIPILIAVAVVLAEIAALGVWGAK